MSTLALVALIVVGIVVGLLLLVVIGSFIGRRLRRCGHRDFDGHTFLTPEEYFETNFGRRLPK